MPRLVIKDVYARKPKYGGLHVIVETDTFYPVGERFALLKDGAKLGFVYVKKVSMDETDKNKLVMQMVDNGDSLATEESMDIRTLYRSCSVERAVYVPNLDDEERGEYIG